MAKASRVFVVDASVARAAGGSERPDSSGCREFLRTILDVCHRITMTQELIAEWREHRSSYAVKWLGSMVARKKVEFMGDLPRDDVEGQIESAALSPRKLRIATKDSLLICAALAKDGRVASLDDNARRVFAELSATIKAFRSILWVNPARPGENCGQWLQEGAAQEQERTLAKYSSQ